MKILIVGIDGYLGWPLALHLKATGHMVTGIDNYSRRLHVHAGGSDSAIPIGTPEERALHFLRWEKMDTYEDGPDLWEVLREDAPDAVVHLGEQPSAAFSMRGEFGAIFTQRNNVLGTLKLLFAMRDACPKAHLVKLGTMGEYGTPNIPIPEGFFEVEYRGRRDTLPFPRQASSWYHWSKVHDSNNVMYASRLWGLTATDIMQGVVFGTRVDAMGNDPALATRFDIDECFGTVVNRFCAQAVVGHPLTVYGKGMQRRGFLPLRDSIQCLTLVIENPPRPGEYRVLNQFENVYDVVSLAKLVQGIGCGMGLRPEIEFLPNPRVEQEDHFYQPDHQRLFDLGYKPTRDIAGVIREMLRDLLPHQERIGRLASNMRPMITWR